MFFYLSKIFYTFLLPLTWIVILLIIGALRKQKGRNKFTLTGLGLLLFFSQPIITNEIFTAWEFNPILLKDLQPHDVAIILSGVTSDQPPRDRVNYSRGADRVLHPIQLYKTGKIKKILVTGGSGLMLNNHEDVESANIKKTLLLAGIPDSSIELETKAKNTHENAQFSAKILKSKYKDQKLLLVTSAYHMRRSIACFEKEGINVTPFPVEFRQEQRSFTPEKFLPSVDSLMSWHTLFKEWLGMVTYKIVGYI